MEPPRDIEKKNLHISETGLDICSENYLSTTWISPKENVLCFSSSESPDTNDLSEYSARQQYVLAILRRVNVYGKDYNQVCDWITRRKQTDQQAGAGGHGFTTRKLFQLKMWWTQIFAMNFKIAHDQDVQRNKNKTCQKLLNILNY